MDAVITGSLVECGIKPEVLDAIPELAAMRETCHLQRVEIIMCNKAAMVVVVTAIPKSYQVAGGYFTSAVGGES